MWTKREQELLCEEVGQCWTSLIELQEKYAQRENDDSQFTIPNNLQSIIQKCNNIERLFHILDSGDDLSFHYKHPSDYNLLITIVQDLEQSEMTERILAKIERERDGKKFTSQAIEYLREKFEEIKRIRETKGVRYFGQHPETITIVAYLKDNFEDIDEDEIIRTLRKGDYSPEELLKDEIELMKLYNEVC